MKKIKAIELFAGVGGFRLGLEGWKGLSSSSDYKKPLKTNFKVVWSNQFEPSTKKIQHANIVYKKRWPDSNHSEKDIEYVIENEFNKIPQCDLLVGGFPCQDYSVIQSLRLSKGLIGKKGVLWWSIYTILKRKKKKPKFLLLENVPNIWRWPSRASARCCSEPLAFALLQHLSASCLGRTASAGRRQYGNYAGRVASCPSKRVNSVNLKNHE